jgi:Rod binding domain-containing protein
MVTSPLQSIATGSPAQNTAQTLHDAQAKKAAQEFESIFTTMMLKSMRGATASQEDDNQFLPTSLGEKIYTEMLDEEYGKIASKTGTIGLANLILKQIQKDGGASMPSLQMLKGLNIQPWMLDKSFVPTNGASGPKEALNTTLGNLDQWMSYITDASRKYNVDPHLISAVIMQESGGNPNAVSSKGAKGLMQLMDTTASTLGVTQPFAPQANIMGGTKYLKQLLDKFDGNEALALASYNAGPAAVDQYKGIPPYDETKRYVTGVLNLKQQLSQTKAASQPITKETSDGTAR